MNRSADTNLQHHEYDDKSSRSGSGEMTASKTIPKENQDMDMNSADEQQIDSHGNSSNERALNTNENTDSSMDYAKPNNFPIRTAADAKNLIEESRSLEKKEQPIFSWIPQKSAKQELRFKDEPVIILRSPQGSTAKPKDEDDISDKDTANPNADCNSDDVQQCHDSEHDGDMLRKAHSWVMEQINWFKHEMEPRPDEPYRVMLSLHPQKSEQEKARFESTPTQVLRDCVARSG